MAINMCFYVQWPDKSPATFGQYILLLLQPYLTRPTQRTHKNIKQHVFNTKGYHIITKSKTIYTRDRETR